MGVVNIGEKRGRGGILDRMHGEVGKLRVIGFAVTKVPQHGMDGAVWVGLRVTKKAEPEAKPRISR